MSDLLAKCDWDGEVLILTLPEDPSSIHVQRAEGQPRRVYTSEAQVIAITPPTTHAVIVSDEDTDCSTGYCRCELCKQPIDVWDHYCRHCGAEVEQ